MSLLMDALKRQHQNAAIERAPAQHTTTLPFSWRSMALVLIMLLGMLLGVLIALWWQQQVRLDASSASAKATVAEPAILAATATSKSLPPAQPGLILSDLLANEAVEDESEQLVVSANARAQSGKPTHEVFNDFLDSREMAEASIDTPVENSSAPANELSVDDVSAELKSKFQSALDASRGASRPIQVKEHAAPARDINTLDDLLQRQIAPLRFEAHVYATDPKQRWVKVNGKDLQEGQWITADIQLKEITPNYVLLQMGRQLFSMEALTEWSYRLKSRP